MELSNAPLKLFSVMFGFCPFRIRQYLLLQGRKKTRLTVAGDRDERKTNKATIRFKKGRKDRKEEQKIKEDKLKNRCFMQIML